MRAARLARCCLGHTCNVAATATIVGRRSARCRLLSRTTRESVRAPPKKADARSRTPADSQPALAPPRAFQQQLIVNAPSRRRPLLCVLPRECVCERCCCLQPLQQIVTQADITESVGLLQQETGSETRVTVVIELSWPQRRNVSPPVKITSFRRDTRMCVHSRRVEDIEPLPCLVREAEAIIDESLRGVYFCNDRTSPTCSSSCRVVFEYFSEQTCCTFCARTWRPVYCNSDLILDKKIHYF